MKYEKNIFKRLRFANHRRNNEYFINFVVVV
jgi:hypothetical protein